MPQRDENDFEQKRQQIIDGALTVFANKGFENATNKDIAQAARIGSPGLIYHYFKDKGDLFREVVEQRSALLTILLHSEELLELPPREALSRFGLAFVQIVNHQATMTMVKLILGEATRRPMVAEMLNRVGPGRVLPVLTRYMAHQMEIGVFRPMDPGAAARCFAGPLIAFILTREVVPQPDSRTLTAEMMVSTTLDIFLQGMLIPNRDA